MPPTSDDGNTQNNVSLGGRWVVQVHSKAGGRSVSIWEHQEDALKEFDLELDRARALAKAASVSLLWEADRVR